MSSSVSNVSADKVRAILASIPQQATGDRRRTISVRSSAVILDCPAWCTDPHAEAYRSLADVSHHSDSVSLAVPVHGGATEQALTVRISCWPFAGDPDTAEPFVCYDPVGDECAQLDPAAGRAAADQVIAHGYAMLALINSIDGADKPAAGCRVAGCDGRFHYEDTCSHILGKLPMGEGGIDVELVSEEGGPVRAAVFGMDLPRDENLLKTSDPAQLSALAARFRAFADTIDRAAVQLGGQA